MARGFASPSILFLNTFDQPERDYMSVMFRELRGRYTRLTELCCGAFVMPSVAVENGWSPSQLQTSDVSLYSAIVGTLLSGGDLDALDIRLDGEPVRATEADEVGRAAELLYVQLLTRMEVKPQVPYWNEVVRDLRERRSGHIDAIKHTLVKLDERLHGLKFQPKDLWAHMAEVWDDPQMVVNVNAPTYRLGFERFFDTKGRLTWSEPTYEPFNPDGGCQRIMELFADKKALLFSLQQADAGHSAPGAVFCRFLAPGEYVYLCTNRPEEALALTGGRPVVIPKAPQPYAKLSAPIVPEDHEFGPSDEVQVMAVKGTAALYYRDVWMHKIDFKQASNVVAVAVGGYLIGMFGYDSRTITRPYHPNAKPGKAEDEEKNPWVHNGAMLLTFAVGGAASDLPAHAAGDGGGAVAGGAGDDGAARDRAAGAAVHHGRVDEAP